MDTGLDWRRSVFLVGKAGGELSLMLSHSGLTMAILLELASISLFIRFYMYSILQQTSSDSTSALQQHPFLFLLYDESILRRRIQVEYSFFDTRRARTSKRLRMKLETRLETWNLHQQLAVLDKLVLGEAISLGLSQEHDNRGYTWIFGLDRMRSLFLEL